MLLQAPAPLPHFARASGWSRSAGSRSLSDRSTPRARGASSDAFAIGRAGEIHVRQRLSRSREPHRYPEAVQVTGPAGGGHTNRRSSRSQGRDGSQHFRAPRSESPTNRSGTREASPVSERQHGRSEGPARQLSRPGSATASALRPSRSEVLDASFETLPPDNLGTSIQTLPPDADRLEETFRDTPWIPLADLDLESPFIFDQAASNEGIGTIRNMSNAGPPSISTMSARAASTADTPLPFQRLARPGFYQASSAPSTITDHGGEGDRPADVAADTTVSAPAAPVNPPARVEARAEATTKRQIVVVSPPRSARSGSDQAVSQEYPASIDAVVAIPENLKKNLDGSNDLSYVEGAPSQDSMYSFGDPTVALLERACLTLDGIRGDIFEQASWNQMLAQIPACLEQVPTKTLERMADINLCNAKMPAATRLKLAVRRVIEMSRIAERVKLPDLSILPGSSEPDPVFEEMLKQTYALVQQMGPETHMDFVDLEPDTGAPKMMFYEPNTDDESTEVFTYCETPLDTDSSKNSEDPGVSDETPASSARSGSWAAPEPRTSTRRASTRRASAEELLALADDDELPKVTRKQSRVRWQLSPEGATASSSRSLLSRSSTYKRTGFGDVSPALRRSSEPRLVRVASEEPRMNRRASVESYQHVIEKALQPENPEHAETVTPPATQPVINSSRGKGQGKRGRGSSARGSSARGSSARGRIGVSPVRPAVSPMRPPNVVRPPSSPMRPPGSPVRPMRPPSASPNPAKNASLSRAKAKPSNFRPPGPHDPTRHPARPASVGADPTSAVPTPASRGPRSASSHPRPASRGPQSPNQMSREQLLAGKNSSEPEEPPSEGATQANSILPQPEPKKVPSGRGKAASKGMGSRQQSRDRLQQNLLALARSSPSHASTLPTTSAAGGGGTRTASPGHGTRARIGDLLR